MTAPSNRFNFERPGRGHGQIRAVTFDGGGTLIDPWPSVGHVYASVAFEAGGPRIEPELLNAQFARAWREKGGFDYSKAAWGRVVAQTFAGLNAPWERFFENLYQRFAHPAAWRIYEDVVPCLDWLKRGSIKLGLISNWDQRLGPLLDGLGLAHLFDVITVSGEFGFHKPAPEIFLEAARRLELPPDQILHVGDSPLDDYEGARAAGFQALLLDRRGRKAEPGTIHSLRSLEDGPKILHKER